MSFIKLSNRDQMSVGQVLPFAQVVLFRSLTPVGQAQAKNGFLGEIRQRWEQPPLLIVQGCRSGPKAHRKRLMYSVYKSSFFLATVKWKTTISYNSIQFFLPWNLLRILNIYMIINIGSVIQNIHCHKPVYPCEQRFAKKHVLIFYLWLKLLFLTTNTNITIKLPSKEIVVGLSIELYLLLGCLLALNTWMSIGE